jgi:tetratricopeptide (TPR) repeat protein
MQPGYLDQAMLHFKKALDDDPLFYPAWPSLALAVLGKVYANQIVPEEASKYISQSLESMDKLHADHPHTHLIRAMHHVFFTQQWHEVRDHLHAAIGHPLNDHFIFSSANLHIAGLYELTAGWMDKAIATFRKALKSDPLNVSIQMELARAYTYKRDFKKALDIIGQVLRHKPDYMPAVECKGWILFLMGRQREGTETFEYVTQHATLPVAGMAGLAYAYARTSQPKLAEATCEKMLLLYQDLPSHLPHYDMAIAYLGAQAYQPMFENLRQAWHSGMPCMLFIEADPVWEEIRRFRAYTELRDQVLGTDQRPPL